MIELWDLIYDSLNHLLSTQNGILGEIIEFWEKAQSFIDGKIQKTLPIGFDGQSRKHHRLSLDGVKDLQNGVVELVGMLQDYVFSFFADPPIEDISMLYSPNTSTPVTPQSALSRPMPIKILALGLMKTIHPHHHLKEEKHGKSLDSGHHMQTLSVVYTT